MGADKSQGFSRENVFLLFAELSQPFDPMVGDQQFHRP